MRIASAVDFLWRALAVLRIGALGFAAVLAATRAEGFARPGLGWTVLGVMLAWTAVVTWAYARPRRRSWPWLTADLAVALACLAASRWALEPAELARATLPMVWVAAPVIGWAIRAGWRVGAAVALLVGVVDAAIRGWSPTSPPPWVSINATVQLLLAGAIVGYVARLAEAAQRQLQQAAEQEAAVRERERLARGIHDSVLQVLALVQRRGAELGGEAAVLGRLAGEQQATLRGLVRQEPGSSSGVAVDLREVLGRYASTTVTISAPAEPVGMPAEAATELAAAVGAALDNVRTHCGPVAPAWVLVEAEPGSSGRERGPDQVIVTVRDDGPGIPDGRLAQAAAQGRLGVAQSIQGRLRDLGGTATVVSAPGQGTEVELRLPLRNDGGDPGNGG